MSLTKVALFLFLTSTAQTVFGQDEPWPGFEIRASAYITAFASDLSIDGSGNSPGTEIDLEDELDLDDGLEEIRVDFRWRIRPRHAIDFSYYDISRDGERIISNELNIGDEMFSVDSDLKTTLDFTVYKLSYAYSFAQSETSDIAGSIGLHVMDLGLEVDGFLLNVPVNRYASDIAVPLPVIGFQYSRRLGGPFTLIFDAELFAIEFDDFEGSFVDAGLTLDVDFTDHVGGFVSLNWVQMNLEYEDDDDLPTDFEYRYGAVAVGVRFTF